jgi:predicted flap endonuclease-1-like 5' DNA nuclease
MMYLIGQLAIWLLLTAGFAAMAGWAWAAMRAAPAEARLERERESLLQDLVRFSGEGAPAPEPSDDAGQRLLGIRDARIAELERALETARARGDELAGELAEQQRRGALSNPDAEELARLRALEAERARTVDAEATPVEDENAALQTWRLRYFEQRVRYLESQARAPLAAAMPQPEPAPEPPVHEWTAREATARAAFLEEELRALRQAPPPAPAEPFAANAETDKLLRWRMLYLERRVAHLQNQAAAPHAEPPAAVEAAPDPDRWKWRARYLEARVRHLEQRPAPAAQAAAAPVVEAPAAPRSAPAPSRRAKPPVLASARNGAPDDLTLIESISLMQQTTLYALGIFHFDQIAAWSEENVAWVDQYLRLQGRIDEEEWVEQAADLAAHGPAAARRVMQDEDA